MIHFIMDKNLLQSSGHGHLPAALIELGHSVHLEEYQRTLLVDPTFAETHGECTVLYGSIQFVEQRMKTCTYAPGAYYARDRFRCSHYMPRLPLEILGNGGGVYLPFSEVLRRREQIYRMFGVSRLFIRPDSGAKIFTGLAVEEGSDSFELQSMRQLTSVTDDTLVLIAPAQDIGSEYRFYIVNGEVITASRYMEAGKPSPGTDVDEHCLALAKRVAGLPWQIDLAYTCDIGLFVEYGVASPKVVELNALSTSGLYQCDSVSLFAAVADIALQEVAGDLSIQD
jgi:hypothetical protein